MIAINWGVYIWAIQEGLIIQASLGYYITPLTYVLVGVVVLKERLTGLQILAVLSAVIGVGILTVQGGEFPWVSLTLAISFTTYGVVRKRVEIGAMPGLFIEVIILFPLASAYLAWMLSQGQSLFGAAGRADLTSLLVMAGPITVLPLLAFAIAARRLPLSMIGFLQFIAPTIQFACAVYYGEPLTQSRMICFAFIWLAVLIFSYGLWKNSRNQAVTA
jgi:chloramphenicol-sensitive protein RarD